jgi:hypothetical protein
MGKEPDVALSPSTAGAAFDDCNGFQTGGFNNRKSEPSSLLLLSAGLAAPACSLWKKQAAATR